MNHRAVPPEILDVSKKKKKGGVQLKLDPELLKVVRPKEFTKEEILHCVAQFIVCDEQVSLRLFKKWYSAQWSHSHLLSPISQRYAIVSSQCGQERRGGSCQLPMMSLCIFTTSLSSGLRT